MAKGWFKGIEERQRVYGLMCKLAKRLPDETVPDGEVIALAQAVKYIMEDIFEKESLGNI
jgi:hypothetical protein